ncbi:MAG: hypothetical protein Q8L60_06810 [Gammaproteobacteria bacterium]|nr:hypothetical protein [Gammaproteobacteria bacterium]MDP2140328.1 hypothetical protein [Gammaproteobacteria bacterium]
MGHDQLSDRVRELDTILTQQTIQLRKTYEGRQVYVARWSPVVVKAAGVVSVVMAIRLGPLKLVSLIVAVSRLWPQVLAFRPK